MRSRPGESTLGGSYCGSLSAKGGLGLRLGEAGGVPSLLLMLLAVLACLDGDAGMLRLLAGRPNGEAARWKGDDGRSEAWLFCEGLRTNGEGFSGDREPLLVVALVGDKFDGFDGDAVGVDALAVAGD